VAFGVAQALHAPLDVIVVRKLGVPDQPELGMGAIGEGGVQIINPHVVRVAEVSAEQLAAVKAREQAVLTQRADLLRGDQSAVALAGRTALIIDDGVATGSTARAACQVAHARGAMRVILAVPVAAADVVEALRADADDVICVLTPTWLYSISEWYDEFSPTTDQEVRDLLARAAGPQPETHRPRAGPGRGGRAQ
jgi:putative phosphoribosyl transferase